MTLVLTEQRRDSFRARGNPEMDPKKILFSTLLVRAGDQKEKRAKTIIKVVVVNVKFLKKKYRKTPAQRKQRPTLK